MSKIGSRLSSLEVCSFYGRTVTIEVHHTRSQAKSPLRHPSHQKEDLRHLKGTPCHHPLLVFLSTIFLSLFPSFRKTSSILLHPAAPIFSSFSSPSLPPVRNVALSLYPIYRAWLHLHTGRLRLRLRLRL